MKLDNAYKITVGTMFVLLALLVFGSCTNSLIENEAKPEKAQTMEKTTEEKVTMEKPTTEKPTTEAPTTEEATVEATTTEVPTEETKEDDVNANADINDDSGDSSDINSSDVGRTSEAVGTTIEPRTSEQASSSTTGLVAEKGNTNNTPKPNGQSVSVDATYYTADCAGCSGVTATGQDVRGTNTPNGTRVISVDPNVIPLGSKVRVDTPYGSFNAVAGDTGGGINGNRIDILVGSNGEAISKGRHGATVTVLN